MLKCIYSQVRTVVLSALVLSILFLTPTQALSAQATLTWDPNDPTPDGYRIYQRTEGQTYDYSQPDWTGPENTATVIDLAEDTVHYFVVRAYDGTLESADSEEVFFSAQSQPSATHTIAVVAGSNGIVSPGNTLTITRGADQTFIISPDSGYQVDDVLVDGVSMGVVDSYTFDNIVADHTITAIFAAKTYAITATAGANGSIIPAGVVSVDHGASKTYTITPNAGYQLSDVLVDGVSKGALPIYTCDNVVSDCDISASFVASTYTISASSGDNGTVSPSGSVDVEPGGSQTFTFTADPGFHIADVLVGGHSMGAVEAFTFTSIDANHTLEVIFSKNTMVAIWIQAEDGDLQWPMEIADDEDAGAGGFVWVAEGTGNLNSITEDAGYSEYHFEVPETGGYVIWGRHVSSDSTSDSFFVSVDGQEDMAWHTKHGGQEIWAWDVLAFREESNSDYAADPMHFHLTTGAHTLRFTQREDGTKLDKILITNNPDAKLNELITAGRRAFASSVQNDGLEAVNAVDGSSTTRWSSGFSDNQWIYVDLGDVYTISQVMLNWETAYGARYEIQVSNNATDWTTVYTELSGDGGIDDILISMTDARYVRMNGLQRGTQWGYSLFEFEVYGVLSVQSSDLTTAGRRAFASSVQNDGLEAVNAVDGSSTTRWSSGFSDNQWIYVDLGDVYTISQVMLNWETAYGARYEIQVSNNATDWTTVYTELSGDGGIDDISISMTDARYVRMNGLQRGTQWGYSLFEFEVYGVLSVQSSDLTTAGRRAFASSVQNDGLEAVNAVDGSSTTRWSSGFSDNQWIYVDLGDVYTISQVMLNWETAYGARYEIQVSNNATDWTTVYTELSGDGGIDDISISMTDARYVRMNGLQRGTQWGYSLFEFEVYP